MPHYPVFLNHSSLDVSTVVICHNVAQEGLCSCEDNESCASSLTFHRCSAVIKAPACRGQHYHPAGEWAPAQETDTRQCDTFSVADIALILFHIQKNGRLTLDFKKEAVLIEPKWSAFSSVAPE